MMNDQLFEMLRDRLESIDDRLGRIETSIRDHVTQDEAYWKKIDILEGQLSTLKWLFGGSISTAIGSFMAWLITHTKG